MRSRAIAEACVAEFPLFVLPLFISDNAPPPGGLPGPYAPLLATVL